MQLAVAFTTVVPKHMHVCSAPVFGVSAMVISVNPRCVKPQRLLSHTMAAASCSQLRSQPQNPHTLAAAFFIFTGGDTLQSRCEAMQECGQHGFQLQSPTDPAHRGSQVCLGHKGGYPIMQVMPQPVLHFAKTVRASGNVQLQAHGMYSIARLTCRSQCVYLFSWPLQPGWQAVPF